MPMSWYWIRVSLASFVDLSSDAYVREPSPSAVCKIDSFIGQENFNFMFLLSEIRIWTVPSNFCFILCMITIID